ncbi:MAG: DUF1992 domain-containing protein [Burkholderiales bacterium]|nr:DUF1992 domain-containing protein [Burkholderiales bacterium]PZN01646.1 MAG: DUF1992 domain-containing protein [Pseudomonadota bacterium]
MSSRYAPLFNVEAVAEERIQEAIRRGDFDNLPGAGRPLELDEDLLVPAEVRVAYRILKNAGCVPPEVTQRREIAELEASLPKLEPRERVRALQKLQLLRTRLGAQRSRSLSLNRYYERKIIEKLGGG